MFQVSRSVEYAILLLVNLARNKGRPLSLTVIAKANNLPIKYLEKISRQLKQNRLISSREGMKGGYLLSQPAQRISLQQIIEAVEGKTGLVSCLYGHCLQEQVCCHKQVWWKMQNKIALELKKISLKDLL